MREGETASKNRVRVTKKIGKYWKGFDKKNFFYN